MSEKPKGVVLAGGLGTRLLPLTRVTNKHLLPVYDRPMVYYPLQALGAAGIGDVLLVTGADHSGDFVRLLGNGREFGFRRLEYAYQDEPGGIAHALALAEDFAGGQPLVVMLGDNLMQDPIRPIVEHYLEQLERTGGEGARVVLKEVHDPERFGVAMVDHAGQIASLVEKPLKPESRLAVVGLYMFDSHVFSTIRQLTPSSRGELEITEVNRRYLERGRLEWSLLSGWWSDAGTISSLFRASRLVAEIGVNGDGPQHTLHRDDMHPRRCRESAT